MNKELRKVIKNAITTATKVDGYSQVIIMERMEVMVIQENMKVAVLNGQEKSLEKQLRFGKMEF